MKQVPLDLKPRKRPAFDDFIVGANAACVAALRGAGRLGAPVYLWGPPGAGRTHLLQAYRGQCEQRGTPAGLFTPARPLQEVDPAWPAILVDDVHRLDAGLQQRLFALLVEAQAQGVAWLAAGDAPPVDLALRDDLRSRLGWGAVFELQPLSDAQAAEVLRREAAQRGFQLGDEVVGYLLMRFARDLGSLLALLDALDGFALARKRAVTVPLLREMLAEVQA